METAPQNIQALANMANSIRKDVVRMTSKAGSGHPGGSLSCVEIVVSLYFRMLRIDPQNPDDPQRDWFVLSKGHAAPTLYSVLARKGFFPIETLDTLRELGSPLQGHPDMTKVPGVEFSTGSLGHGLSASVGVALGLKLDKSFSRVYVLLGDGEIQEGSVWEGVMGASHYGLDNLCAILDYNGLQIDGKVCDIMGIEPIRERWSAFGWNVLEVDGHNFIELLGAYAKAKECAGKPTLIIANTVKGRGVSFMEHNLGFHGKAATIEEMQQALSELEKRGQEGQE